MRKNGLTTSESSNNQEYQCNLPTPTDHDDNQIHKMMTTKRKKQEITTASNNSKTRHPLAMTVERGGTVNTDITTNINQRRRLRHPQYLLPITTSMTTTSAMSAELPMIRSELWD